jgi:hypothetical protein
MRNKTEKIIDAISEQPKFVTILKNKPSWIEKVLAWLGYKRLIRRTFKMTKLTLFNKFRISSVCLKLKIPETVDLEVSGDNYKLVYDNEKDKFNILLKNIPDNLRVFCEILAIALINGDKKPDKKLVDFIFKNATSEDILKILPNIIHGLDLGFFLPIMILIDKEKLLEAPKQEKKKH